MNRTLVLRLPSRKKIGVYLQIILVMTMLWFRDVLNVPSIITYLTDVLTVYLLVSSLQRIKFGKAMAKTKWQNRIFVLIVFCMAFGAVINLVNPILVLWAVRNNLRFFAFFYICIGVMDTSDVDSIINLIKVFFWLNVGMCIIQYYFFGLSGDNLGGLFGIVEGCNAYMNVLLCMISAIMLGRYFSKRLKLHTLIIYLFVCVFIAVLAELKVYYIEIAMMIVVAVLCLKELRKKLGVALLGVTIICVTVILLVRYDPRWLEFFGNLDAMEEYLAGSGYTASNDLNRLTAIRELYSRFFEGKPIKALLGFGLGSCETASYRFLQSDFFEKYGHLHYRWFTHAWVYLEQGAIGLILLILFFVSLIIYTIKKRDVERQDLFLTTMLFLPTCLSGIIYNSALQIEVCYMIAFMCSIPFVLCKNISIKKEE